MQDFAAMQTGPLMFDTIPIIIMSLIGLFVVWLLTSLVVSTFLSRPSKTKTETELQDDTMVQLPLPPKAAFCDHQWQTLTDKVIDGDNETTHILIISCPHCGIVDKTITKVSKRCQHKWVKSDIIEAVSAYEQMHTTLELMTSNKAYGMAGKKGIVDSITTALNDRQLWVFRKAIADIRTCNICGEINTVKIENFSEGA